MLTAPTSQHHETKVAQLCQNFIRCTVFLHQKHIRGSLFLKQFSTTVQYCFPLHHQQAITLPFDFYQLISQQLLTVYAESAGQI
ncbi:Uncharacterised protein [Escherichia coli]|nr:Uncharacterised protein [Escherichia coli]SQV39617.1 Uncharacterised protein [Escherichia coli]SQV58415.1 Uncharacterised protein [Escherichia coli]SQW31470.1 Uncharacterised protein [Escherichia coli]